MSIFLGLAATVKNPLTKMSLLMLAMIIPYGTVFGYGMTWRYLMFVPFVAFVCSDALPRRASQALAMVFLSITSIKALEVVLTPWVIAQ